MMERKTKLVIVFVVIAVLLTAILLPVFLRHRTDKPDVPVTELTALTQQAEKETEETETTVVTTTEAPEEKPFFSPEEAVGIYMNNKDLWLYNYDYEPMGGYGYGFIDLDFDGVLELVAYMCDGSGRYSCNEYYRINEGTKELEHLKKYESNLDGMDSEFDYYLENAGLSLYRHKDSGKLVYFAQDFTRVSSYENGISTGILEYKDGLVYSIDTFYTEYMHRDEDLNETMSYAWHESKDEYEQLSKEVFIERKEAYFSAYTDLNLKCEFISGYEFEEADADEQKEILLQTYKGFSYTK